VLDMVPECHLDLSQEWKEAVLSLVASIF
jgi:hypothetical protein